MGHDSGDDDGWKNGSSCDAHVIRPHPAHGFAAYDRKTGRLLPVTSLDTYCANMLKVFRGDSSRLQ